MLVVGTRPEYFNSVWVKNEWSRYLKIIKKDRNKLLIPCYKDMDAYDLPEEFSHLQAQDMGKIGFINDVIRGVRKAINPANDKSINVENNINSQNVNALLERAFMFLEDKDWTSCDQYCERVLDIEPKNYKAYLIKLMVDMKITKQDQIVSSKKPLKDYPNFEKAIRFADPQNRNVLSDFEQIVEKRLDDEELLKAKDKIEEYKRELNSLEYETNKKIKHLENVIDSINKQNEKIAKKLNIRNVFKYIFLALGILGLLFIYGMSKGNLPEVFSNGVLVPFTIIIACLCIPSFVFFGIMVYRDIKGEKSNHFQSLEKTNSEIFEIKKAYRNKKIDICDRIELLESNINKYNQKYNISD